VKVACSAVLGVVCRPRTSAGRVQQQQQQVLQALELHREYGLRCSSRVVGTLQ
jgi:hypothetical protein